ncbi:hypothetical protein JTB14_022820 [Gonioctena quinquepunctata]|nr:hypothetical protein JTB14_022820 [Gonioctena quinquepunctata]
MDKNDPGDKAFVEKLAKSRLSPATRRLIDIGTYEASQFDLFEHCNVDCYLEILYLGTSPAYRSRGIAKKLSQVSVEVARRLNKGENVKHSLDGEDLELEPVPKVVSASFTSPYSMRIGRSLDWEIVTVVNMRNYLVDGKPLPHLSDMSVEITKLE